MIKKHYKLGSNFFLSLSSNNFLFLFAQQSSTWVKADETNCDQKSAQSE